MDRVCNRMYCRYMDPVKFVRLALAVIVVLAATSATGTDFEPSSFDIPSGDPLIEACRKGDIDQVQRLVELGASLNSTDKNGLFPLKMAAHKGNLTLLKYLLGDGADVNFQPSYWPAITNSKTEEIALFLLESGTDLDRHRKGKHGMLVSDSLFFVAARNGWKTLLARVYKSESGPDQRLSNGRTPLYGAARGGHLETVRMLLSWGAEVDVSDDDGFTPLIGACCSSQLNTATELISAGADPSHQTKSGKTVLTVTVSRCWNPFVNYRERDTMPILELLMESGAIMERETLTRLQKSRSCQAEYEFLKDGFERRAVALNASAD